MNNKKVVNMNVHINKIKLPGLPLSPRLTPVGEEKQCEQTKESFISLGKPIGSSACAFKETL